MMEARVLLAIILLQGIAIAEKPGKIVGGHKVGRPIPYQISLRTRGYHFCGGTIIDPKFILSAAHCMPGKDVATLTILAGSANNQIPDNTSQIVQVAKAHYMRGYQGNKAFNYGVQMNNDVVILELAKPLELNKFVQKAALPTFPPPKEGTCYTSGWGELRFGGPSTHDLMQADVPVLDHDSCNRKLSGMVTRASICAGGNGKDSCRGDSGGPFVCYYGGSPVITGIVSWGVGCAERNHPGVYSNVFDFMGFINATLRGEPEPVEIPPMGCPSKRGYKDGFCDDVNNTPQCNFDGGDCCGIVIKTRCRRCQCLEQH